ncbi:hypothetical protein MKW98_016469 [Papaver atlanticum]|uniref:TraB family protein n=1 Tax=Papaver atlanticum TaxID=357466 RepID=A0AAD4T6Q8_9MAGN|nr:hypothetical protein MKW98_016469 [Papaver atlanticum]
MSSIILNDDTSHYQHGIPGIPTDGKVVVLKNSKFNSEVYLVGTVHISKQSAETVKKVINYVRPKAVGIELSEEHAKDVMNSETEDVSLFEMLCDNMRAPWDLPMKIDMFAQDFWDYQFRAKGIHPGLEFKVAMEEASRMRARCYLIDEDDDVIDEKLSKVFSWLLLWKYWKFVLAGVKSVLADVFKARKARNYSLSKIIEGATESTRANGTSHERPLGLTRRNMNIYLLYCAIPFVIISTCRHTILISCSFFFFSS